MKVLKLTTRTDPGPKGDEKKVVNLTAQLVGQTMGNRPKDGFDITEMRARSRVLDAVDKAVEADAKEVQLEDADAEKLQACLKLVRWNQVSKEILEFADDVEGMKDPADEKKTEEETN